MRLRERFPLGVKINLKISLISFHFDLWLAKKTCAILSINQIQN